MVAVPNPGQPLRWLGGQIDIRVEVDTGVAMESGGLWDEAQWDVDEWGGEDPAWFDISPFVEDINITLGTERWGQRFTTGSATIVVDNTTGIFMPEASGESGFKEPSTFWHLPFRPGRRLRVVAIPDPDFPLVKVPQFTGFIDSSSDSLGAAATDIHTTLQCLDYMAFWAAHNPVAQTPTGVQKTEVRVEAALDLYGWPDDADHRDIQTGVYSVQTSDLAQTILETMMDAAVAEGGAFFASADGKATFKSRDWLTTDTRSTVVQGYIGYATISGASVASAHHTDVTVSWELARVANQVRMSRVGGVQQLASDGTSQSLYGIRTYEFNDLQNTTDAGVLFLTNRYLDAFKDNRMRLDSITITGNEDPLNEDKNRLLYDTQLGDRLSVLTDTPFGWFFEREVHVFGISQKINAHDIIVTFQLDDAQV